MEKKSDPRIIGPGVWYIIHTVAIEATDDNKKYGFITLMNTIKETFPCEECRKHIVEYMENNPFTPYWNIQENGRHYGMFKWTWNFHNTVNRRLGKKYVEWETAKGFYDKESPNFHFCTNCTSGMKINFASKL